MKAILASLLLFSLALHAAEVLPEGIKSAGYYGISVEHLTDAGVAFLQEKYGKRGDARLEFTNQAVVADYARLKELPWAHYVEMRGVIPQEGLDCLTQVVDLRHWVLSSNQELDSAFLAKLTKLETIQLTGVTLKSLDWVKQLPDLRTLSLHQCKGFTDLTPLTGLPKLSNLNLYSNNVTDKALPPIGTLKNLESLRIGGNEITSLAPLSGLAKLRELDCIFNKSLTDISALAHCPELQKLVLWGTSVGDITALKNCAKLTELNLADCQKLTDLAPLAGLTALRNLRIDSTAVASLAPLKKLTALTALQLNKTPVNDLSPLADLLALSMVELENTTVTDISVLSKFPKLFMVRLPAGVPAEAVAQLQQAVPKVRVQQQKAK